MYSNTDGRIQFTLEEAKRGILCPLFDCNRNFKLKKFFSLFIPGCSSDWNTLHNKDKHGLVHIFHIQQGGVIKHFLSISESGHYAGNQVYFYKSNSKKSARFSSSKNLRALKKEKNLCENLPLTAKNNSQKESLEFSLAQYFVQGPPMGNFGFAHGECKNNFIQFLFSFCF